MLLLVFTCPILHYLVAIIIFGQKNPSRNYVLMLCTPPIQGRQIKVHAHMLY